MDNFPKDQHYFRMYHLYFPHKPLKMEIMVLVELVLFLQHRNMLVVLDMHPDHHHLLQLLLIDYYIVHHHHLRWQYIQEQSIDHHLLLLEQQH